MTGPMRNLPQLNYLRSFEASARLLSFTAAAAELNLTQAAVSGHIRALEQFIGGPLFTRHPRSLSLTSLGTAYLPNVQQALAIVEQATDSILKSRGRQKVVISCPVSLAETWLARVVADFGAAHPDVPVTIHGRVWQDEPATIADIILTNVHSDRLSKDTICLWQDQLAIVCAPGYRVEGLPLTAPEQLLRTRLIHNLGRSEFWHGMMAHFGLGPSAVPETTHTSAFSTALALAAEGYGVAIAPESITRKYLAEGILTAPFGTSLPSPWHCTISDSSLLTSEDARCLHRFIINAACDGVNW